MRKCCAGAHLIRVVAGVASEPSVVPTPARSSAFAEGAWSLMKLACVGSGELRLTSRVRCFLIERADSTAMATATYIMVHVSTGGHLPPFLQLTAAHASTSHCFPLNGRRRARGSGDITWSR